MKKTFTFGYDEFCQRFKKYIEIMNEPYSGGYGEIKLAINELGFKEIGIDKTKMFFDIQVKEDYYNRVVKIDVEFNEKYLNINPSLIEFNDKCVEITGINY